MARLFPATLDGSAVAAIARAEGFLFSSSSLARHLGAEAPGTARPTIGIDGLDQTRQVSLADQVTEKRLEVRESPELSRAKVMGEFAEALPSRSYQRAPVVGS